MAVHIFELLSTLYSRDPKLDLIQLTFEVVEVDFVNAVGIFVVEVVISYHDLSQNQV